MEARALVAGALLLSLVAAGALTGHLSLLQASPRSATIDLPTAAQATPGPAASGPWTRLGAQPPGRYGHGFVYDSKADLFIAFGGVVTGRAFTNSTWVYNDTSNTWTNVTPVVGPSPRSGAGLVYDPRADRIIMFGGYTGAPPTGVSDETWAFDLANDTWTNRTTPGSPPAREGVAMAFDAAANRTILFGGFSTSVLGDTWAYDDQANVWTQRTAAGPSARFMTSMAYDNRADRAILFGGAIYTIAGYTMLGDTWTYDYTNDTWTQRHPGPSPPEMGGSALAFDEAADRLVLFGGGNLSKLPYQFYNVTWTYDLNLDLWSNITPAVRPSARFLTAMDFDRKASRTVLFAGGRASGGPVPILEDDVWSFQYGLTPPSAPRNLRAAGQAGRVVLSWLSPTSEGGSPITNYTIHRGTASGGETLLATVGNVLTHTDSAVTNGQTYYYEVAAVNSGGEGQRSNEASATPIAPPDTTPPSITIGFPANNTILTTTTVTVSGTASDDVALQKIELSPDGTTWTIASGTTSWSGTLTLPAGANVIYVRATDASGNRATTRITVTVQVPGPGPVGLDYSIFAGILIALVAGVLVAIIAWRRKKRDRPPRPGTP